MEATEVVRYQIREDALELALILENAPEALYPNWGYVPEGPVAYGNGNIPISALAPIPGPVAGSVCYLRKDAAAAWNAMNRESQHRYGVTLRPLGYMSAYRTLGQQYFLWDHSAHPHDTNWVARPGTSNHGLALAVDLQTKQMRWIVDQIGEKYGFAKKWSDAPMEWWHIKWRAGNYRAVHGSDTVLRYGSKGLRVRKVQRALRNLHIKGAPRVTGYYGVQTRRAVKRFQRKHHLTPDGRVGSKTWHALFH